MSDYEPFGTLTPEARVGDWKVLAVSQHVRIERLERENAELRARNLKLLDEVHGRCPNGHCYLLTARDYEGCEYCLPQEKPCA